MMISVVLPRTQSAGSPKFANRPGHTCMLPTVTKNILLLDQFLFMNSDSCTTISRRGESLGPPPRPLQGVPRQVDPSPHYTPRRRSAISGRTRVEASSGGDRDGSATVTYLRGGAPNANTLRSLRTSKCPWTIGDSRSTSVAVKTFRRRGV